MFERILLSNNFFGRHVQPLTHSWRRGFCLHRWGRLNWNVNKHLDRQAAISYFFKIAISRPFFDIKGSGWFYSTRHWLNFHVKCLYLLYIVRIIYSFLADSDFWSKFSHPSSFNSPCRLNGKRYKVEIFFIVIYIKLRSFWYIIYWKTIYLRRRKYLPKFTIFLALFRLFERRYRLILGNSGKIDKFIYRLPDCGRFKVIACTLWK